MREASKLMEQTNCKMEYYSLMRFRNNRYKNTLRMLYVCVLIVLAIVTWMIRLLFTFPTTRTIAAAFVLTAAGFFWLILSSLRHECKAMDKQMADIKQQYDGFDNMLNVWEHYQSTDTMRRNDLV